MTAAGPALEVRGVTKRFGGLAAVSGLSFSVPAGSIYGLLGPNGAGKTTTLRMIGDIAAPDEGSISILGRLAPGREASRHIGYLPEERGLYPKMRARELLQFFGALRGLPAREARRRADAWLDRLGLGAWARAKVQELSKGMAQKLQFAASLVHDPELLILDEPWSGLDPLSADVLRAIVLEKQAEGRAILFSTHLMEQAEKLCDRVCILARGERVLEGELGRLKREEAGDRAVIVAPSGDAARAAAHAGPLADPALVAAARDRSDHIEVELAAEMPPDELLAALVRAGVSLRRFEILEPSLHELFVERVGAEAAGDAGAQPDRRAGGSG